MAKAKAETGKPVGKIGEVDVWCKFDKLINTETLIENPRNPNEHSTDQINRLAIIIKYQGWRSPIVISNRSGFVIKGHCRLASARALKMLQVPVEYQDYESEASEWADLIADNIIAELATTNRAILSDNILALDELNFNLDLTGLDKPELDNLMLGFQGEIPPDKGIPEGYNVVCVCESENEQKELYERLIKENVKCQLQIL
jgi:hypothetical protein